MDMDMDMDIALPEETALKVKQLEVKCENLEADIKMTDCCFNELDADQEEDRHKIERLEKRVTQLEADLDPELRTKGLLEKNLYKLTNRVSEIEVELEKTELLEERVSVLNIQNFELRDHLNSTIDTLNNVVKILNGQVIDEEQVVEGNPDGELLYPEQDMEDDTQPTLSQVYAMYQSQPPDEEGWDEMTAAIKAAEEHEASRKVNQNE